MADSQFDFPQTEEGLQEALAQLAVARGGKDSDSEGEILLRLSQLVKWVRSDNDESPFQRAETLALEALTAFRASGNVRGQVRALIRAISPLNPTVVDGRLDEAERLLAGLDDPKLRAGVIAARSRSTGLRDRARARELAQQALALYREIGDAAGMAGCLFGLSIAPGNDAEKLAYATEASDRYREAGNVRESGRVLGVAVMNCSTDEELIGLEPRLLRALEDAHASGERSIEKMCYSRLAKVCVAKGDSESALRYSRWASELDQADSLTELERWEQSVDMTKMLLQYARAQGDKEAIKGFQEELKRIRKEKPKE